MATPSQAPGPTTTGELLFQNYLDSMHYAYEFEKEFSGKSRRPDYTIEKDGLFLFDVKDFEPNMPLGGGAYDPYPRIREKIDQGRKKFKEFKEYPCSLVLKNNGNAFVHLESPDIMLGSMYGDAGLRFPVDTKTGVSAGPMKRAFLKRGKMIHPNEHHNTTISALITLRHIGVGSRRIDQIWQERKREDENFGQDDPFGAYDEIRIEASKRFPNFDPEEKQLGVIVWENAVARIPLSRDLFAGPYDERWGFDEGYQSVVFRGEKLAVLSADEES